MAAVFWIQEKFALAIASQLENLPVSAARISELGNFCDRPVIILSARSTPQHRREEHAAMAHRLQQGDFVYAKNSNHWIMQEEPELVVRAIQRVVDSYRGSLESSSAAVSGSKSEDGPRS
jgi:pimeloyl-ACP methyl ester carboxylesterase